MSEADEVKERQTASTAKSTKDDNETQKTAFTELKDTMTEQLLEIYCNYTPAARKRAKDYSKNSNPEALKKTVEGINFDDYAERKEFLMMIGNAVLEHGDNATIKALLTDVLERHDIRDLLKRLCCDKRLVTVLRSHA